MIVLFYLHDYAHSRTGIHDVVEVHADICRTLETRVRYFDASVIRAVFVALRCGI